jgi:hypothetical protein
MLTSPFRSSSGVHFDAEIPIDQEAALVGYQDISCADVTMKDTGIEVGMVIRCGNQELVMWVKSA